MKRGRPPKPRARRSDPDMAELREAWERFWNAQPLNDHCRCAMPLPGSVYLGQQPCVRCRLPIRRAS